MIEEIDEEVEDENAENESEEVEGEIVEGVEESSHKDDQGSEKEEIDPAEVAQDPSEDGSINVDD